MTKPACFISVALIFSCGTIFAEKQGVAAEKKLLTKTDKKDATQNCGRLQFSEVLNNILRHYPQLRKQSARIEEALAQKSLAFAGMLPRLSAGTGVSRGNDPTDVFMMKLKQGRFTADDFQISALNNPASQNQFAASAKIEWTLFDAFQTIGAIRTARLAEQSASQQRAFIASEASLLAFESYIQLALITHLTRISSETEKLCLEDLKQAEDLMNQGVVLGADFYAGRASFAGVRQMQQQTEDQKKAAAEVLNILQGIPPEARCAISGDLPSIPTQKLLPLNEWTANAFQLRTDLSAMKTAQAAQASETGRHSAARLPKISAFAQGESDSGSLFSEGGEHYLTGIQATVDIWDPAYGPRIKKSQAAQKQLHEDEMALRDQIAQALSQTYAQHRSARANLPILERGVGDARQAVELTGQLYRDGKKSVADLMQLRLLLLQTDLAHKEAQTRCAATLARMLFLSGQLTDAKLIAMLPKEK